MRVQRIKRLVREKDADDHRSPDGSEKQAGG